MCRPAADPRLAAAQLQLEVKHVNNFLSYMKLRAGQHNSASALAYMQT
jgi:hypothetical protein